MAGPESSIVRRLERKGLVVEREGIAKPLSAAFSEFVARQSVPGLLQADPIIVDLVEHSVLLQHRPVSLTPTEFALLSRLIAHPGEVVKHEDLAAELWNEEHRRNPEPERLKAVVRSLRRSLGKDALRMCEAWVIGSRDASTSDSKFTPNAPQFSPDFYLIFPKLPLDCSLRFIFFV
jgi:DNA-binding response OmpR family regulator